VRKLRGHPACEVINAGEAGTAFLVCDHASNRVPWLLGNLGLEPAQLADHIGWDPGAAEVARRLSGHLDAPLGLSGYSRLAVDCNRPPDSRESITAERRRERTGGIGRSRLEIGQSA
jgi:predicted N-formylglutamate amidohydrolase